MKPIRSIARLTTPLAVALALGVSVQAWAADTVSGAIQDGYGRLSFNSLAASS